MSNHGALANPLISVIALSYNSQSTILETLESIFAQDYPRIELIICDDASSDGCIDLVESWLCTREVKSRFEKIKVIVQEKNIGIVRNLTAGIAAQNGEWIKPIACDDVLVPSAISSFLSEANLSNNIWLFSQCTVFEMHGNNLIDLGNLVNEETATLIRSASKENLLKHLLKKNFLPAPSAFYSKNFIELAGGHDLGFQNLEDWPLWVKALSNGMRPDWISQSLVMYRKSPASLTWVGKHMAVNRALFLDELTMMRSYLYKRVDILTYWDLVIKKIRQWIVLEWLGNYQTSALLIRPLALLSPLAWVRLINKLMIKLKC